VQTHASAFQKVDKLTTVPMFDRELVEEIQHILRECGTHREEHKPIQVIYSLRAHSNTTYINALGETGIVQVQIHI
jgi:hypothetical protein